MSNILVIGGAGFIGYIFTEILLDKGKNIVVFYNFTSKMENLFHLLEKFFKTLIFKVSNIRNLENCRNTTEWIEYIFHEAALGSVPRSI